MTTRDDITRCLVAPPRKVDREALRVLQRAVAAGTDDEGEEELVSALVESQTAHLKHGADPHADSLLFDIEAVLGPDVALADRIISRGEDRVNKWDLWETHKAEIL